MRALAGVAVACVLVLSACGEDDSGDKSTSPPSSSGVSAPATASSVPTTAQSSSAPSPSDSAATRPSATSAKPSSAPASSAPPSGPVAAPKSKEGAIQRYEDYLHAVGREDIDVMCEIAGPAMKGYDGPCREGFTIMLQMFPAAQKAALRTATVDGTKVVVVNPAKVEMPATAVKGGARFTENDLGDHTLEYTGGNWFITD
ncbi:hypothetical protein [Streptodolium elevatio]